MCVVFMINRLFYPASSVHKVSVLNPYPGDILLLLWSHKVRQRKNKSNREFMGQASEMPANRVREDY